jgi:uncharacterized membrane protein
LHGSKRGRRRAVLAAVGLAVMAGATQAQAAGSLTMVDLGVAPGDVNSSAIAINASGVVIGSGWGIAGKVRPWIYEDGVIAQAPGLPAGSSFADINDSGLIVGTLGASVAMTYQDGTAHALHPALGDNWAEALAVDNDGTVVGISGNGTHMLRSYRTVRWAPGSDDPVVLDVFPVDQYSKQEPNAVVDGRIVGHADASPDSTDAFAWQDGTATHLVKRPGDLYALALDVNAKGVAVGWLRNATDRELPVKWNAKGKLRVLPTFPPYTGGPFPVPPYGVASAISQNLIVGESELPNGPIHAVAWKGKTLIDLGSFVKDSAAYDVTSGGRIVGTSRIGDPDGSGPIHAVLWTLKGKGPAA